MIMAVGAGLAAIPGWVPLRGEHAALILAWAWPARWARSH